MSLEPGGRLVVLTLTVTTRPALADALTRATHRRSTMQCSTTAACTE